MDWCVDPTIDGAVDGGLVALGELLQRHASQDEAELALSIVRRAFGVGGTEPWWMHVDWRGLHPALRLGRLEVLPDASRLVALSPGVSDACDLAGELPRLAMGVTNIGLAAARWLEPVVDPPDPPDLLHRAPAGDVRAAMTMVACELASHAAGGHGADGAAAAAGARLAHDAGTMEPSLQAVAAAYAELSARTGGGFRVVESDDRSAVLATRRCPFGPGVREAPALCQFTAASMGRVASRALGADVHVSLHERLALGDTQCRMAVSLDAAGEPGWRTYRSPPAGWPEPPAETPVTLGFRIALSLRLPRDRLSVPLIRHLCRHAMQEVGVVDEHLGDVELALTEACTNVLDHAGPGDAYDVELSIRPDACDIRVIDIGHGFDAGSLGEAMAGPSAEEGRGISLMHALMDQVRLVSEPESGTIVHLVKRLAFDDSVPARRLMLDALPDGERAGDRD